MHPESAGSCRGRPAAACRMNRIAIRIKRMKSRLGRWPSSLISLSAASCCARGGSVGEVCLTRAREATRNTRAAAVLSATSHFGVSLLRHGPAVQHDAWGLTHYHFKVVTPPPPPHLKIKINYNPCQTKLDGHEQSDAGARTAASLG